jgi:DNA invertase Pin-like site-specific DNA recombinase
LDIEVHLAKEGQAISKNSRPQDRMIYGINVAVAHGYLENLKKEVKKEMREKYLQGIYPGHAQFCYRNNKVERTIEAGPYDSATALRLMKEYAISAHTLFTLQKLCWHGIPSKGGEKNPSISRGRECLGEPILRCA